MSRPETPEFRYRQPRIDDIEEVEQYVLGGYHPVDIGDVLGTDNKQYEIIHKLGYGGFSTVWLVRSCLDMRYFALKILCADVSDLNELRIFQHLKSVKSTHPNVVILHDSFKVNGPNGEHLCLLFPALGPSLRNLDVIKNLSAPARHLVCKQIASGVAFLHDQGICHGDLTISNIVFELPDIQSMSPNDIYKLLGPIKSKKLKLPDGSYSTHSPKRVIQAPDLSGLDHSLFKRIQIIDFGQSFFTNSPPPSLGIPIQNFPPEICFGYSPSDKSDIWSLACVLFQMHCVEYLVLVFFPIFEMVIGTSVGLLDRPIPIEWKGRFNFEVYGYRDSARGRDEVTDEPLWWFEDRPPTQQLNTRLSDKAPHLSAPHRASIVELLQKMMAYEPGERISAISVAQHLDSAMFLDNR